MSVVGLDLAGVETRPTGYCTFKNLKALAVTVYTNKEIIERIEEVCPQIIAIDAPLSLPPGRKTLEERNGNHLRECDRELLRRHIRFFPITLGPMRKLTTRGIHLKKMLEEENFKVIEVYPGGAQDILNIPRKQKGLEKLKKGLKSLGIKNLDAELNDHELDAVTCAYVGKLFLEGESVTYGNLVDGIVMPKNKK